MEMLITGPSRVSINTRRHMPFSTRDPFLPPVGMLVCLIHFCGGTACLLTFKKIVGSN